MPTYCGRTGERNLIRLLFLIGIISIVVDYVWVLAIVIYAVVAVMSFKTGDKFEEAKDQGIVCLQPQRYPDLPPSYNHLVQMYITSDFVSIQQLEGWNIE
jgi:hypothetical protein